jgi:AcrR family transcriptional regulator
VSPRPDVSAQRVPQILLAATEVVGRRGLGVATVAEIAEHAGLSKALVFKYFRSKDELVAGLVRSTFDAVQGPQRGNGTSCAATILDWSQEVADTITGNPAFPAIAAELLATASRDTALRAIVTAAYGRLQGELAALITVGIDEGEFRRADADAAAVAVLAQMEGCNALYLVAGDRLSLRAAYSDGIALLLAGLAVIPPAAPRSA